MGISVKSWLWKHITDWLMDERSYNGPKLSHFDTLKFVIRPCDVVLVQGRSRVSDVIRMVTQNPWTHAALYIGRISDIPDPDTRAKLAEHYNGNPEDQLVIEGLLGQGTVINSLENYKNDHLRICRPIGLTPYDATKIVDFAVSHVGYDYSVRHIFDFMRFLLPWSILPRRWRSSLFQTHAGNSTKEVCSIMIAQAFSSVHFPIMPLLQKQDDGTLKLYRRNFNLFTPRDFDYSPYFEVIKYTYFGSDDLSYYRRLPWDKDGVYCDDEIVTVIVAEPPVDPVAQPEVAQLEASLTEDSDDNNTPAKRRNPILSLITGKEDDTAKDPPPVLKEDKSKLPATDELSETKISDK